MTENNETPNFTISVETIKSPDETLNLLGTIRADLQRQLSKELGEDDARGHVLVSVIENGVFVACILEDKNGEYRYGDITPESVYELWKLKQSQYTPVKGAWFSVEFTSGSDGFIVKTQYNYDKRIYSGDTPENWFVAPETETELYNSPWDVVNYQEDLKLFPRKEADIPDWLK